MRESKLEEERRIRDTLLKYVNEGDEIVLHYTIGEDLKKEEYRVVLNEVGVGEVRKALEYMGGELEIYVPSRKLTLLLKRDDAKEIYVEVKNDK